MITYSDLIQKDILIVGMIALFSQANHAVTSVIRWRLTVCRWHPRFMFSILLQGQRNGQPWWAGRSFANRLTGA